MRSYLVIYEKAARNYSAYCPDLPGCISTGKTLKETQRNMKEAILLHLEGFRTPPPASKTVVGTLRV